MKLQPQSREGQGRRVHDYPHPVKSEPQTIPVAGMSKGPEQLEIKDTSIGGPEAKSQDLTRQQTDFKDCNANTEGDLAKYDELGYLKPEPQPCNDQEEHEYNYPDLVKPSVNPRPQTIAQTGICKDPEEVETKNTSTGGPEARNQALRRQLSDFQDYDSTAKDPKYDESGYLKPRKDQGQHEYDYPDQVKPSIKPEPHTILMTAKSKNPEQLEMKDTYLTMPGMSKNPEHMDQKGTYLQDDPNRVQAADQFHPSKIDPAFVPNGAPSNEYSYAYGHFGSQHA